MELSKELIFINFATEEFLLNQQAAIGAATKHGLEKILPFNDKTLNEYFPQFLVENPWVPTERRGYGYWLWKPFLLLQFAKMLPQGTSIMYCDCGVLLNGSVDPLVALLKDHDQIFFNMPQHSNGEWAKRDLFIALNADNETYWKNPQVKAQWHLWKVCQSSIDRIQEWYTIGQNKHLIDDSPSVAPNLPGFVEHRHDQSILSILVQKWGCEIFRDPTTEGERWMNEFKNSPYSVLGVPAGKLKG